MLLFLEGITTTGVILHNSVGFIIGALVNCFVTDNPFCVEAEAAIQAHNEAVDYPIKVVTLEGDAFNEVMALNGLKDFVDWKGRAKIVLGRHLLHFHYCWQLNFSPL